ncbi:uncharacterized protein HMPREF1541_01320 [Cyphellophora europaea CBS 101466]|uniref:Uncharacterized protein n=1 Tax=Cyphellophora europaea (strain CBS 101466) TaxID=1220924 RepID=W2SES0_CYPE1|nr:uncharacterized protein HMPREF1541_01320 [Cyphellophora europaea CBS 101466]ETN47130.1 hypothetical protein HMPREF1541_01320 [Cyphellophora europaea CBS 101466]
MYSEDQSNATFSDLPPEILLQVIRSANLGGNILPLRLASQRLHKAIDHQATLLLCDLRNSYNLPHILTDSAPSPCASALPKDDSHLLNLLTLQTSLSHLLSYPTLSHSTETATLPCLLLTSHLHRLLTSAPTQTSSSPPAILCPSTTLLTSTTTPLPPPYLAALSSLPLHDLDTFLDGVNVTCTVLWRAVEACWAAKPWAVGVDADLERAVVAEIALWRGVRWCLDALRGVREGRIRDFEALFGAYVAPLAREGEAEVVPALEDTGEESGGVVIRGSVWRGRQEEATKLATGGLAAWLWGERKRRHQEEVAANGGKPLEGVRVFLGVGVL